MTWLLGHDIIWHFSSFIHPSSFSRFLNFSMGCNIWEGKVLILGGVLYRLSLFPKGFLDLGSAPWCKNCILGLGLYQGFWAVHSWRRIGSWSHTRISDRNCCSIQLLRKTFSIFRHFHRIYVSDSSVYQVGLSIALAYFVVSLCLLNIYF